MARAAPTRWNDAHGTGPEMTTEATTPGRGRRALREFTSLYWESGLCDDVPAMAWFLASSLVPLALGLTALATVILGDYAKAQELAQRVSGVLPKDVHDQVVQLILRTKTRLAASASRLHHRHGVDELRARSASSARVETRLLCALPERDRRRQAAQPRPGRRRSPCWCC